MRYSFIFTLVITCILCVASCKTLFKKEPDCVLQAWALKDPVTGVMVAANESPFTFDTTVITILSLEQCGNCPLNNSYKVNPIQAILDQDEINLADTLYQKAVAQYNAGLTDSQKPYRSIDITKDYKRQYIAVSLVNGHKEVWINAFCSNHPEWKKQVVQVEDGGPCYFNVTINLKKKSIEIIQVNGEG